MPILQPQLTKSTENLIQKAHSKGVPRDQLDRFLKHGYVPLPWALDFHAAAREADKENGPVDIGAGGARGPGKSHAVFAQITIDDCQRVDGLKALFLRQTGKSADESFQDLVDSVIKGRLSYKFNSSRGVLKFPNGSRVLLGGFEDEKDIDKYIGIQYDIIAIEERNQLTGEKVLRLKGSLRTTKANWRARCYSSFNPGNIGHADVKKTFVEPYKLGKETKTRFFPSTYRDNPFLKPEYIEYLDSLPGALGKAWREGNFDTFEGQYFLEWDFNKHVVRPFPIPQTYKRYRAYDHGRDNPACCKWYAVDYDGRVWVYKELYVKGLNIDQIALEIGKLSHSPNCVLITELKRLPTCTEQEQLLIRESIKSGMVSCSRLEGCEVYEYSVADPSIFANTGFTDKFGGQTIAESFARQGVMFLPASNRRVDGWNLMHQYLFHDDIHSPKIVYFNICSDSIRTIPTLIHDKNKPEDLDTKGEDHAADVDRYLLMSLHEKNTPKPKTEIERKLEEMKRASLQTGPKSFII